MIVRVLSILLGITSSAMGARSEKQYDQVFISGGPNVLEVESAKDSFYVRLERFRKRIFPRYTLAWWGADHIVLREIEFAQRSNIHFNCNKGECGGVPSIYVEGRVDWSLLFALSLGTATL